MVSIGRGAAARPRSSLAQPPDPPPPARAAARARCPREDDGALRSGGLQENLAMGGNVLRVPLGAGRAEVRGTAWRRGASRRLSQRPLPRPGARPELVDIFLRAGVDADRAAERAAGR